MGDENMRIDVLVFIGKSFMMSIARTSRGILSIFKAFLLSWSYDALIFTRNAGQPMIASFCTSPGRKVQLYIFAYERSRLLKEYIC